MMRLLVVVIVVNECLCVLLLECCGVQVVIPLIGIDGQQYSPVRSRPGVRLLQYRVPVFDVVQDCGLYHQNPES